MAHSSWPPPCRVTRCGLRSTGFSRSCGTRISIRSPWRWKRTGSFSTPGCWKCSSWSLAKSKPTRPDTPCRLAAQTPTCSKSAKRSKNVGRLQWTGFSSCSVGASRPLRLSGRVRAGGNLDLPPEEKLPTALPPGMRGFGVLQLRRDAVGRLFGDGALRGYGSDPRAIRQAGRPDAVDGIDGFL